MGPKLVCRSCGWEGEASSVWRWIRCPRCGAPLDTVHEPEWFPRGYGVARYSSMLSIEPVIDIGVGGTPTVHVLSYGDSELFFKLEYLNPGGSFKDRGALLALSLIEVLDDEGVPVVEDSSGNTAISIAMICRALGRKFIAVVPENAPEGKRRLLSLLGAEVIVSSNRREATEKAIRLHRGRGYAYVDHLANPLFIEGAKTIAYEVFEYLGVPDIVIAPVGSGGLFLGLFEGFQDLVRAGVAKRIPRFIAVQGVDAMDVALEAEKRGLRVVVAARGRSSRLADGIRVPSPPRLRQIVDCLEKVEGAVVVLSDSEISDALRELIDMGFVVEPTSAAAYAAFKVLESRSGELCSGRVLIPLTGSGYKMLDLLSELHNAF